MDLRIFLSKLEQLNELQSVDGADWHLEIGALSELINEHKGTALLFDHIKGYPSGYRIITNLLSTPKRLGIAFGFPENIRNVELVGLVKDKFQTLKPIPPIYVDEGPVLENILRDSDVDLMKFPAPKWHEEDGGRYLGTGDMVIMKDPHEGWINVGTYRVQLHDQDTLGLFIAPGRQGGMIRDSYWSQGKSCPVAVVFGAHPLVLMPATLAFPWGTEEYGISGGLLGQPLQLINGEYTGLPIPAYAELVIEGEYTPPEIESRPEGPFGEWPGYYASGARNEAVIKVKRIMHRNDPIILGYPPLKPPSSIDSSYILRAASIWTELERLSIPGIKGVWHMRAGGTRFITVISIEQKYAGHAKQVAMASMAGPEGANLGRFTIIVDDDIDPTNDEEVLWAMATRCDPATAIEIISGCWSTPLDPLITPEKKAMGDFSNSRAIIMAVRPFHWRKEFPRVIRASDSLREETFNKWKLLFPKG